MSDAPRLILVGRVAGAFGVRGELRIASYTADPVALAGYGPLQRKDGTHGLTLTSARPAKGPAIVARAREVASREDAERLRGLELYLPRERLPATDDEDEFYLADLIGLSVVTPAGETLGVVKSVHDFGAGDLLEVQPQAGASWWLPFTKAAVPDVSLADGRLTAVIPDSD